MHPNRRIPRVLLALLAAIALGHGAMALAAQPGTPAPGSETELTSGLPPVDLPTMNEQSYTFELESVWQGDGDSVPLDVPVYTFQSSIYTEEQVAEVAEALGVEGEITSQGEGVYTVEGEGSIFTTPGLLQYVSAAEAPDEPLPDDEAAIAMARDWLRTSGLLPADIGDGQILATIETPPRKIVGFTPASPTPLLSSTPGLTVTVGPGGAILEARVSWAEITLGETFRLRGVDSAIGVVQSQQAYLDVTLPEEQFPQGSAITGTATYDSVSIAYTTSGQVGDTQYLQPVYVFSGTLQPVGSDDTFPITAYVPGIITSQQPVGVRTGFVGA